MATEHVLKVGIQLWSCNLSSKAWSSKFNFSMSQVPTCMKEMRLSCASMQLKAGISVGIMRKKNRAMA